MTSTPRIKKEGIFLQALVGFLIAKISSDLYSAIAKKVKRLAVKYLSNQFVLNYIASHDPDPQLRIEAVSKLISPTLLRKLLVKEKKDGVRLAVLRKLRTVDVVKEYRRSLAKASYKLQLIPLVKTQDGLFNLLQSEGDQNCISLILKEITSPRVIARLPSLPQPQVKEWAKEKEKLWAKRKREETSVVPLILQKGNPDPKLYRRIQVPKDWYLIAKKHKSLKVRLEAISRLEGNSSLLAKLEGNTKLPTTLRLQAASLLGGTKMIADIARTDPNPKMRMEAVALLDPKRNGDIITSIMKWEKKSDVLTQAILVTTSEEDLEILKKRIKPEVSPQLLKILEERRNALTPSSGTN